MEEKKIIIMISSGKKYGATISDKLTSKSIIKGIIKKANLPEDYEYNLFNARTKDRVVVNDLSYLYAISEDDGLILCTDSDIKRLKDKEKRRKRGMFFAIAVLIFTLSITISLSITMEAKNSAEYERAMNLIEQYDYSEAYDILLSVDYKDSKELAEKIAGKIKFSDAIVGDIIVFGKYEQDGDSSNGKEDIEWRVLEKDRDKMLLISKYGLDSMRFHHNKLTCPYKESSVREWLNTDFFEDAFNEKEKQFLKTALQNVERGETDWDDDIFLLSVFEAEKYFYSDSDRACRSTVYARERGGTSYYMTGNSYWWLRTPGGNSTATYVGAHGEIGSGQRTDKDGAVVRPAMWISIK